MIDMQTNNPGRREFLATLLAAGYALAVQPVTAQTLVMTDRSNIEDGMLKIPNGDFEFPAYMARPAKGKDFPVLLVVQEILACMSISRMCAAGWQNWVIWPLRPSCTHARAALPISPIFRRF